MKTLVSIIFFFIASVCVGQPGKGPQNINDSIKYYTKAIESDRNNPSLYLMRGFFYAESGSDFLALADMSRAIELSPKDSKLYYERSRIYFEQKRPEKALTDINKSIELDSSKSLSYIARAIIFGVLDEPGKAMLDYNKAVALDKDGTAYLARASAHYEMEDIDASCADYQVLKSYIDKGKIKDQSIITEVKARVKDICDSSRASYYYQRAIGFYNQNEFKKAAAMYERGLKKFPQNSMMLSFSGNAWLALAEYEKAVTAYSLALKYKDNLLAEIKQNPNFAGAPPERLNEFYNGSLAATYFTLSQAEMNLNRLDEALADITKAIELAPDVQGLNKDEYFNLRGHIHLAKEKYEPAINDFTKSIQLNNRYALPYVNRAIAKVSMGQRVKIRSYSMHGNLTNQPMSVIWDAQDKASLASKQAGLLAALHDCDIAISIDKQFGFAFYIRGQIKQMLGHEDYCYDLLAAKKYGILVEDELLKNCGK